MTRRRTVARILVVGALLVGCAAPAQSVSPTAGGPSLEPSTAATASPAAPTSTPTAPPTSTPTFEPDPTPEGASAPRLEVEINANVTDRPGVPASVRDRYWWTQSDVGLLGTTAQVGVPSSERIIHAADGLVVSVRGEGGESDDEPRVELIVRDFPTGAIVRRIDSPMNQVDARIVGRRLFWTGDLGPCTDDRADAGVWSVDVDGTGDPVAIVESGHVIGCSMAGRQLKLSASGETLGAVMAGYDEPNWIDVIDVATLIRRDRIDDVWPWALTDDTFLQWDHKYTDGLTTGMGGITAYSLSTGAVRWKFPQAGNLDKFAPWNLRTVGDMFVIEYIWATTRSETELVLAIADPLTGERRTVLRQDDTASDEDLAYLQPELSSSSHLTLRRGSPGFGAGPSQYAVVDVATAAVDWEAFTIDPPWLCFEEYCFRD